MFLFTTLKTTLTEWKRKRNGKNRAKILIAECDLREASYDLDFYISKIDKEDKEDYYVLLELMKPIIKTARKNIAFLKKRGAYKDYLREYECTVNIAKCIIELGDAYLQYTDL